MVRGPFSGSLLLSLKDLPRSGPWTSEQGQQQQAVSIYFFLEGLGFRGLGFRVFGFRFQV